MICICLRGRHPIQAVVIVSVACWLQWPRNDDHGPILHPVAGDQRPDVYLFRPVSSSVFVWCQKFLPMSVIWHCGKSGPLECGSSSSPVREALLQERISAVTPTKAMKQLLKAVIEKSALGKIVIKGDLLKAFSKLLNGSSSRFD